MNGRYIMPDTPEISEARQALLAKYLRGEMPKNTTTAGAPVRYSPKSAAPDTDSKVSLVAIQANGTRRPFFYAHVHVTGGAFYCFPLALSLGPEQPFYMLDPYKFASQPTLPTFDAMIAAYIESMRSVQPEGPYLLGGFCGGGVIAFEMARQLRAEGQSVDLLVLVEPGVGPSLITVGGTLVRRIGNLIRLGPDKQMHWFLFMRHLYRLLLRPGYRKLQGFSLFPTIEALRQDWMAIFVWMLSGVARPRLYPGKATYIWARDDSYRRIAWPKIAGAKEGEAHFIPGTHFSLITDKLPDFSALLKSLLDQIQVREEASNGKASEQNVTVFDEARGTGAEAGRQSNE
jgi:Thioesterase domain